MKEWFQDSANIVLLVAIATTCAGVVRASAAHPDGTVLAFSGSLWMLWATVLKERRKAKRDDADGDDDE